MKQTVIFIMSLGLFISCSKKSEVQKISVNETETIGQKITDTLITREVDIQKLPVEFQEEFTNENQKLLIQLKNIQKGIISGEIVPESNEQNIRFNNIQWNDKSIDGPFGKDFSYLLDEKEGYSLIIGKNLMAEGTLKGKFTVKLK